MINPQKEIERVTTAKEYIEWKKNNSKSYLCSLFCIQDNEMMEDNVWQVSYYNPKSDTITTFTLPVDKRKKAGLLEKESKIFKQKGEIVEKLNINKVKINDTKALETAKEFLKEKSPSERIIKEILLLQHNKDLKKTVWNITLMTSALNILNTKIDSSSNKILEHSLKPAMELRKEMEKED